MPRARATSDEMTLQEQLDAKVQECMQVHEANRTMMKEVREMTAELENVKGERDRLVAELNKMAKARQETQVELWKLKARLYDQEHRDDDL